ASTFRLALGGTLNIANSFTIVGKFVMTIQPSKLEVVVTAKISLSFLGDLAVNGNLLIDSQGLVLRITVTLDTGANFGSGVGLSTSGRVRFEMNTSSTARVVVDGNGVSHTVQSGALLEITGAVNFLGLATASGTLLISYSSGALQVYVRLTIRIGNGLD